LNRDSPALTPGVTIDNGDECGCTASSMFLSHTMPIYFSIERWNSVIHRTLLELWIAI
jgi:hypothetical protein